MENMNGKQVLESIITDNAQAVSLDDVSWGYDSWQDSHR